MTPPTPPRAAATEMRGSGRKVVEMVSWFGLCVLTLYRVPWQLARDYGMEVALHCTNEVLSFWGVVQSLWLFCCVGWGIDLENLSTRVLASLAYVAICVQIWCATYADANILRAVAFAVPNSLAATFAALTTGISLYVLFKKEPKP